MKDELVSNLGIKANMKKMYTAKKRAMNKLNRNYVDYLDMLVKMKFVYGFDKDRMSALKFLRLMFNFATLKNGYINRCRWFIGLDGCHLKGPFGGVLLLAVAIDANNGIFPIAACIFESECADRWK
ncbi:hypothetical protein WN943_013917 [Citrus x changshan-huyou]